MSTNPVINFGGGNFLTIEDLDSISNQTAQVTLCDDPGYIELIRKGPETIKKLINSHHLVYGVNTGLGDNCTVHVPSNLMKEFPTNAVRALGCGLGSYFDPAQTRAIIAARLNSLARGKSGVRLELLNGLVGLLQNDILPLIPTEGSVGASGDLVPLSYIAAALSGQRKVLFKGEVKNALEVLKENGMSPLKLILKEGLGILNGTSAMTGVAALAFLRAEQISRLSTRLTSLAILALKCNLYHYDERLFAVKPHQGQMRVAARIREDLLITRATADYSKTVRLQDRYSIRCAPHVIGVLEDALVIFRQIIETELNSTNDNPIIDVESQAVFHGGMFYGGHIAFAMDSLKTQVANIADLMDRQLALLVDPKFNNGLPNNLTGALGERSAINHGLKGLQIAASSWTAEALKLTIPASVFSRSTECHNQDKVSMGMIAVRDMLRILDLTEQVAGALMISVRQALVLRLQIKENNDSAIPFKFEMSENAQKFVDTINDEIPFIKEDIELEETLRMLIGKSKRKEWNISYQN